MKACRGHWMAVCGLVSRSGRFRFGQKPRYPLNRRLCDLQRPSRHFGEHKHLLPTPGFEPRTIQPNISSEYIKPQTANSLYKYRGEKNSIKKGSLKSFVHIDHLTLSSPLLQAVSIEMTSHSQHTTNTSLLCRHYNEPCFHPRIHPLTDQSETVAETRDREYRIKNKTEGNCKKTAFRWVLVITIFIITNLAV